MEKQEASRFFRQFTYLKSQGCQRPPQASRTAPQTSVQEAFVTYPGQRRLFRGGTRGETTQPLGLYQTRQIAHG